MTAPIVPAALAGNRLAEALAAGAGTDPAIQAAVGLLLRMPGLPILREDLDVWYVNYVNDESGRGRATIAWTHLADHLQRMAPPAGTVSSGERVTMLAACSIAGWDLTRLDLESRRDVIRAIGHAAGIDADWEIGDRPEPSRCDAVTAQRDELAAAYRVLEEQMVLLRSDRDRLAADLVRATDAIGMATAVLRDGAAAGRAAVAAAIGTPPDVLREAAYEPVPDGVDGHQPTGRAGHVPWTPDYTAARTALAAHVERNGGELR